MEKKQIKKKLHEGIRDWFNGGKNTQSGDDELQTSGEPQASVDFTQLEVAVFDAVSTVIAKNFNVGLTDKEPRDIVTVFGYDGDYFDLKLNIDQFIPENQPIGENGLIGITQEIANGMKYNGCTNIKMSTGSDKIYMDGNYKSKM